MSWHSDFPTGFAIVPTALLLDTRLRSKKSFGSIVRVYIALASHASTDGTCRVTEARLCEISGIRGEKEVREFLNLLVEYGYIIKGQKKGFNTALTYTMNVPSYGADTLVELTDRKLSNKDYRAKKAFERLCAYGAEFRESPTSQTTVDIEQELLYGEDF